MGASRRDSHERNIMGTWLTCVIPMLWLRPEGTAMQRQRTTARGHGTGTTATPRLRVVSQQMRAGSRPTQQARAGGLRRQQAR